MKPEELKEALLSAVNTICEEYAEDKPKFKVGDWVKCLRDISTNDYQYEVGDMIVYYPRACWVGIPLEKLPLELWEPTEGELCVFWYEKDNYYIRPYKKTLNTIHPFIDDLNDAWDYIAPLEYIATL